MAEPLARWQGSISELEPLLRRLDTAGPRYTSYPTAPQFTESFGPREWESALARTKQKPAGGGGWSLYTHLPFCDTRCNFCGCYTIITQNTSLLIPYLEALHQDIRQTAARVDRTRPVTQFHIGGGTPNYLTPAQLTTLMEVYRAEYAFAPDAEIGIELDPRDLTGDHLATLHALGFNRFSMGVQDFDPTVQEAINRHQSLAVTAWTVETLRGYGHQSLNLDLIYGLPYQTPASFAHTVEEVLRLRPSRLALYSYAHVPWKSPQQRRFTELPRPEGAEKFALFLQAYEQFLTAGYVPIGFDHFALPDDELVEAQEAGKLHRNFMGYTTQRGADMLAAGVSGIADLGDTYAQNLKKLPDYYRAMEHGELPILRGYALSREDQLRRALIIDLSCNFRLDIPAFEEKWQLSFPEHFAGALEQLQPLADEGLFTLTPETAVIEPLGRFFVRNICMAFDQYLPLGGRERQFSRTL